MKMLWTLEYTEIRISEAVQALRGMSAEGCFPAKHQSCMPDPIQSYWEVWNGLTEQERNERLEVYNKTRVRSQSRDITNMDEVIFGLNECFLDRRNIKLLIARNFDRPVPWRTLANQDGRSHEWLRLHVYPEALESFSKYMRKKELTKSPDFGINRYNVGKIAST